jgi:hypothetical protein
MLGCMAMIGFAIYLIYEIENTEYEAKGEEKIQTLSNEGGSM